MKDEFDVYVIIDDSGDEYDHFFDIDDAEEALSHYNYQSFHCYRYKYKIIQRKMIYSD